MQSGNLAGVMTGQFAFEEDTLRQDVTFILEPLPQMDHTGGIVVKFEDLKLAGQNVKAFAK